MELAVATARRASSELWGEHKWRREVEEKKEEKKEEEKKAFCDGKNVLTESEVKQMGAAAAAATSKSSSSSPPSEPKVIMLPKSKKMAEPTKFRLCPTSKSKA